MGQEQPTPDYNDQPDLDRTQPSPSQPAPRLDWRPAEYQSTEGEEGTEPETPPVRRVSRPVNRRRRPPTEGAPAWVVGLGIGAVAAVIILLIVAFVFSRGSAEPEPTPTAEVVTPTPTLVPRPSPTAAQAAPTATADSGTTDETATTAPATDSIAVGGYVRVAAQAGLSFRQTPSTDGVLIIVLESGNVLEVIGGPQQAGGYTWWQLRRPEGQEGWSAEGAGEDVFLVPAPAP